MRRSAIAALVLLGTVTLAFAQTDVYSTSTSEDGAQVENWVTVFRSLRESPERDATGDDAGRTRTVQARAIFTRRALTKLRAGGAAEGDTGYLVILREKRGIT